MPHLETLLAIAALAVAFQGFAGVAFVVRQAVLDGRFWSMLASGFAALALALIPLPLFAMNIPEYVVWPSCNVLLAVGAIVLAVWTFKFFRINSEINRRLRVPMPLSGPAFSIGLLAGIAALQIFAVAQNEPESAYRGFAAGLGLLLVRTGFVFMRVLVVWAPKRDGDA